MALVDQIVSSCSQVVKGSATFVIGVIDIKAVVNEQLKDVHHLRTVVVGAEQMERIVTVERFDSDVNIAMTQKDVDAFDQCWTLISDANEHQRSVCVPIDAVDIDGRRDELTETTDGCRVPHVTTAECQ